MASGSEFACIYFALILHEDEVTMTSMSMLNVLGLACLQRPWLMSTFVGAGGPALAAGAAPAGGSATSAVAAPAEEKKVEAKKEESEESDDDMGFGLFD
ncbi:60S acidic ribosomal protein P1-like [Nannospalax galili]|uniref:60S acidic ribosomal protein P1-like n=1 Tax=Nannospalax galili TaxID=1026970 RepID=UPI0004ED327B|nr:60S acidic ribosomal protein P1-like [Nannospalax galili]